MDSLTHVALGAALGLAVMSRRTALWKAAAWGSAAATLPDLDTFIDHGDALSNMTLHRGDSHALFWLSLLAPVLGWLAWRINGRQTGHWRWWWLMFWLALVAHPLLDLMTVYGTQLARPFSDHPYGAGSIFIIDPLYTLPLLVGVIVALRSRSRRGLRWNAAGLVISTAYLGWSFAAQQHVSKLAEQAIAVQAIAAERVLVTPTAFNTVLWRIVVMTPGGYREGFYSLLDSDQRIDFERFDSGDRWYTPLAHQPSVQRVAWFSHGFYGMSRRGEQILISDLRMGQEPTYTFSFIVARVAGDVLQPVDVPQLAGSRPAIREGLAWLWRRAGGARGPPPR